MGFRCTAHAVSILQRARWTCAVTMGMFMPIQQGTQIANQPNAPDGTIQCAFSCLRHC